MSVEVLKQIWPEWQIEGNPLGKGSFGVVYKAVRRDHGVESYAAIKVISIPSDSSEVDSLRSEGLDMNATRTYLQGVVNDFVSEIQLMESLKGVQNIVSVEDYKVVEKTGEIGWDIYIRMELLTSFNTYICDKKLSEEEIIKLGCDICTALEICARRNIIHRDIKPENIFINDFGYFKLGDFGIARKMENITGGLSQKGTFNYMAPEVANSSEYDARVDTYSLGIVLYRLLNGNRLPFLDTEKQLLNPNERRNAIDRRLRGEELPAPCDASPAMANLILRACAYDPNMRFASATEMKQALMSVANGTYQIGASNLDRTTSVRKVTDSYDRTTSVRKAPAASNQKSTPAVNTFGSAPKEKSKMPAVIAAVLAVVLLVGAAIFVVPKLIGNNETVESGETSGNVSSENSDTSSETADYSKFDEEQIASFISEAEALASEEDYEGALVKVQTGLITYPKSAELQDKADEYTEALNAQIKAKTLDEAKTLADSGDYVSAIALIKNAQETQGDDADYQTALKTYSGAYKAEVIASADALAADGDYVGALGAVGAASAVIGNDTELSAKSAEYEDAYTESILEQVNIYVNENNYVAAESLLQTAVENFPNNIAIKNKLEEISAISVYAGIIRTYSGTYSTGGLSSLRGFDLEIVSCDQGGNIDAVFSFYSVDGSSNLFGNYKMKGKIISKLNDGSILASLEGTEWIVQPGSYYMIDFDITINSEKTIICSDEYELYGTDVETTGLYDYSDILKTYSGTYMPNWGVTCLDLSLISCDKNTGDVQAEFSFYPHEHNPDARTGRFLMMGKIAYVYPDGSVKIALTGYKWIEQPNSSVMLDFYMTINSTRTTAISDSYQINLTAQ